MVNRSLQCAGIAATLAAALAASPARPLPHAGSPETVMITLHAKAGADSALLDVIHQHWATVQRLGLVQSATHLTLRGVEDRGQIYFVEILTWRDADIPDHAPDAVRAWWTRMAELTEPRNGRPAIDIVEVTQSTDAPARP